MSDIAIVAIPRQDDRVWKISSEKVPHLTLLYLGDQDLGPEASQHIAQFVEHVANTSLHRFGMDVDKRGVLGDKEADVLFFNKHNRKMLENLRGYLLTNDEINKAYHSVEQFPTFTPHLTLGYPDAPAKKPDPQDDYGIHWVSFDRLAVWFNDFDGPTFDLTDEYDDMVADVSHDGFETVDDIIEHYGVKGMKWGVHRSREELASEDAKNAAAFKGRIKSGGGTHVLENRELQSLVSRMNLEQQYSKLSNKPTKVKKGHAAVKELLALGATANAVILFSKSPAGKALGKALKNAAQNRTGRGSSSGPTRNYAGQIIRELH